MIEEIARRDLELLEKFRPYIEPRNLLLGKFDLRVIPSNLGLTLGNLQTSALCQKLTRIE